jgi:hypothetical protein
MSQIRVAAEDRFAVVGMDAKESLFAHPFDLGTLSTAASELRSQWDTLWDFRSTQGSIYSDVVDAYDEAAWASYSTPLVLASPDNIDAVRDQLTRPALGRWSETPQIVEMRSKPLPSHMLDLEVFAECHDTIDYSRLFPENTEDEYLDSAVELGVASSNDDLAAYREELDAIEAWARDDDHQDQIYTAVVSEQAAKLQAFLSGIASNSLLTELAIFVERDAVKVIPYHAHSVHHVEDSHDGVVLVRPARVNQKFWRRFQRDLVTLETLLSRPDVSEREIESLLLRNPLFLAGLNYRAVYPQVVLPQENGRSLRPDVIAEPVNSEWAHIIELKLPSQEVLIGREGRASLASGIHSAVRQLHEYSAYFDDRRVAQQVEQRYGFQCYRPKLVVIVGRDPSGYTPEEQHRALTSYPDLEVVTYDKLLSAARSRLLL